MAINGINSQINFTSAVIPTAPARTAHLVSFTAKLPQMPRISAERMQAIKDEVTKLTSSKKVDSNEMERILSQAYTGIGLSIAAAIDFCGFGGVATAGWKAVATVYTALGAGFTVNSHMDYRFILKTFAKDLKDKGFTVEERATAIKECIKKNGWLDRLIISKRSIAKMAEATEEKSAGNALAATA